MPEIPETNPYQAPEIEPQIDSEKARAEKALRVLLLILLVPSYLNFGIFVSFVSANRTFTIINFCLILILAILIWHLGFSFMIRISGIIHKRFASSKDLDRWQSVLFRSILLNASTSQAGYCRRDPLGAMAGRLLSIKDGFLLDLPASFDRRPSPARLFLPAALLQMVAIAKTRK